MPRNLRRLWSAGLRALLAAGSLSLVFPAVAQPPTFAPRTAAPKADPQSRVEEIRCELAWLGHASTCPWPLRAQVRGTSMTVTGVVPTEAARQKAMDLAKGCTTHIVRDGVKVNPALQAPKSSASVDQMLAGVMDALHDVIGDRTEAIEVSSRDNGQITLRGTIYSFEEKLAVGQRVRQVPGCTCVVNNLNVSTVVKDGKTYNYVSADGLRMVPSDGKSESAQALPVGKVVAVQHSKTASDGKTPTSPTIKPVMHETEPILPPIPEAPQMIADGERITQPPVATDSPDSTSPYARKTPPSVSPAASPYSPYAPVKNSVTSRPVNSLPVSVTGGANTAPTAKPSGVVAPTMPANWMNEKKPVETTPKVEPVTKSMRPIPEKPYVAMGYVIFEDDVEEVAPAVIQTSATMPNASTLRQRILAACSGKVKDVKVVSRPDRTMEVTVVVPESLHDEVSTKVLQIPEMGSPSVKLNIEVHH